MDFDWQIFFWRLMNHYHASLSRLDIAMDDMEGILDLGLMESKMKSGEIISCWRQGRPMANFDLVTGEPKGKTLYFGSRTSEMMRRFYDKKEREREEYEELGKELPEHWIRCELEMKGERANTFAMLYYASIDEKDFGTIFCEMWDNFITAMGKLRLSAAKTQRKVEDAYLWVKKSVAPTLSILFKAAGGDVDFFMDLVKDGAKRVSKKHIIMLEEWENKTNQVMA